MVPQLVTRCSGRAHLHTTTLRYPNPLRRRSNPWELWGTSIRPHRQLNTPRHHKCRAKGRAPALENTDPTLDVPILGSLVPWNDLPPNVGHIPNDPVRDGLGLPPINGDPPPEVLAPDVLALDNLVPLTTNPLPHYVTPLLQALSQGA